PLSCLSCSRTPLSRPACLLLSPAPRPATSTLFPYTTLFRSDAVGWAVIDYIKNGRPKYYDTDVVFVKHMPPFDPLSDNDHHPKADRKSTRLNSSHVSISYAVFCLKNKITTKGPVMNKRKPPP